MAIKDGSVASAGEVMDAYGGILSKSAYAIWNQDFDTTDVGLAPFSTKQGFYYAGNNLSGRITDYQVTGGVSGSWTSRTSTINADIKLDDTDNSIAAAFGTSTTSGGSVLFTGENIDDFSSGSLDTSIWDVTLYASRATGTTSTDYYQHNGARFTAQQLVSTGGSTGTCRVTIEPLTLDFEELRYGIFDIEMDGIPFETASLIQVVHGSGTATIWSQSGTGSTTNNGNLFNNILIKYDPSASEVVVKSRTWVSGTDTLRTITTSTSGWTGTGWRLQIINEKQNSNSAYNTQAQTDLRNCMWVGENTFTNYATFDTITSSNTITHMLLVPDENHDVPTSVTYTYQASADNGVNWENITANEIHYFTNTGTNLIVRVKIDGDGTTTPISGFATIPKWVAYYNLY